MLPRHGLTYSVLLLVRVASLAPRRSIDDWADAARAHGSYLASAIDLEASARSLAACGLVSLTDPVLLSPRLAGIADLGATVTLQDVSRVLLAAAPPPWLRLAVSAGSVSREYIPAEDLKALLWLEPELDRILLDTYVQLDQPDQAEIRKRIGEAAELVVFAALRHMGHKPVRVSQISDAYGYDIEVRGTGIDRIEVKAAGPTTRGTFHLTRNEYVKSLQYGKQWRLIQVIFNSAAFVADEIDASHVGAVHQLAPGTLQQVVPPDTPQFAWEGSALLSLPDTAWCSPRLVPDPDFKIPGIGRAAD
ncbi:DUF3883 domain-containing protein [Planotetraspora sp. A-T 1434]|uniref:DUF3883 domain-containing protein n=1 Tax=Planotetraspora sp. A-T 1434 TaxID=2979219 RepID=UPI0021C1796B|nr:DUF3883 domain-containing protein [Planotetraspora sp. A-T 1434]MCT9931449.1 DUF3883 domain-containing protein [Planotetraspora sp. A-T 1434]